MRERFWRSADESRRRSFPYHNDALTRAPAPTPGSASLRPDEQLEGERTLAERFGVARPTVRSALARLQQEGLVQRRGGGGTFVTEAVSSKLVRMVFYHGEEGLRRGPYAPCFSALNKALAAAGHRFDHVVNPAPKKLAGPPAESLSEGDPPQAIVTLGLMNSEYIEQLAGVADILLTVDYATAALDADAVVFDSFGAGMLLAEHVISLGHERVVFVGCHRGVGGAKGQRPTRDGLAAHARRRRGRVA